jgi:chromosome segregation ATPase
MVCKHIGETLKKIDELGNKIRSTDLSLYEKLGPYVKYEVADEHLNFLIRTATQTTGKASEFLKESFVDKFGSLSPFHINSIKEEFLSKYIIEIIEILQVCKCLSELKTEVVDKHYDPLVEKHNNLVVKYNSSLSEHEVLQKSFGKLKGQYDDLGVNYKQKDKALEIKEKEYILVRMQSASLKVQSENYFSQLVEVRKLLESKEKKIIEIENKLDQKQQKIDVLTKRLSELEIDNSQKAGKIREKEMENEALNENLGETQKDLLSERLEYKKEKLEAFATQLGIELQRIQKLRKRYRELLIAQENNNINSANIAKENITATKDSLGENGISVDNIQKLCKKCEKVS